MTASMEIHRVAKRRVRGSNLFLPPCTKPCRVQSEGPTRWIRLDWL
jgi:hypothetical protein